MVFLIETELYGKIARKVIREHKPSEYWNWLCQNRKHIANSISKTKDEAKIGELIKSQVSQFVDQTSAQRQRIIAQTQSNGKGQGKGQTKGDKGHGKGKSTPSGKGGGKGGKRHDMLESEAFIHIPSMNAFKYEDGTAAHRIDFKEHDMDSMGIVFGMIDNHAAHILEMDGEHTPNAQAFVLFGDVRPFEKDKSFHLYKTQIIKVPSARQKGDKITDKDAILVNVGSNDIIYNPCVAKVTLPASAYTTFSYRIVKSLNDPKVFNGTAKKEGFLNHVHTTLKAEWLYAQVPPNPTSRTKTTKINDTESDVQHGYINVKPDKINEVLKRSGHNGATIWYNGHDESTFLIDLHRKTTHKEALEIIKRVGDASLGLINKNCGRWCIRVLKDESIIKDARAKIDPGLSAIVGPLLMNTPNAAGCRYIIKGLLNNLTYSDVAKMMKDDFKWNVRPEKFLSTNSKFNNMVVFSSVPPPQRLIQFTGTSNFVEIEDFVERKPQTKAIDKIFDTYNNKSQTSAQVPFMWGRQDKDNKADTYDIDSLTDELDVLGDVAMTAEWFDTPFDEPDNQADAPVINLAKGAEVRNQWELRKSRAIKEAAAHAEEKAAKNFWQSRKEDEDKAQSDAAKDLDNLKTVMMNRSDVIKNDNEKEFQRLKDQLVQQNLENQTKIDQIMQAQKDSKEQFDKDCKSLDERLDGKLLELFGTVNASIVAQDEKFGAALLGTTSQVNELQTKFTSLESRLIDFMDNFGKKTEVEPDAKKARGSVA